MELRITECTGPLADHLEQFKQYASIPDDSRDGVLLKMLKDAMLQVQEYSDKALLPCSFELTVYNVKFYQDIRLYQGGKTVTSVKDGEGNDLEYFRIGNRLRMKQASDVVIVTYSNEINIAEAEQLQPIVWQLATAIYDGEDAKAQASILRTAYGPR